MTYRLHCLGASGNSYKVALPVGGSMPVRRPYTAAAS